MGELHIEVFLKVFGGDGHVAAHIDVGIVASPPGVDVGVLVAIAESTLLHFPCAVIEVFCRPFGSRLTFETDGSFPVAASSHVKKG